MTLGIGVITYNRQATLIRTLGALTWYTCAPYFLVVAEDGGTDDTTSHMHASGITTITGKNHGVCWNKNRALYTLLQAGADPILLLEDDCHPAQIAWEEYWLEAAPLFHHVNYVHPNWPANWCRGGSGAASDPFLSWEITGQATVTTAEALKRVGYLDTRFKGYGFGHINWTERFCKAGYINRERVPCIRGGLTMDEPPTFRNMQDVQRNYALAAELRRHPFIFIPPWQSDAEEAEFKAEIAEGLYRMPLIAVNTKGKSYA